MATPDGSAAPALTALSESIREYSLFQAVVQVIQRLREAHPLLDDDALYDQLEFQANPGLGFPGHDIDRVEFFVEARPIAGTSSPQRARAWCGAGSPLAGVLRRAGLRRGERDGNPTRDFLDLFHHRLHRLMLPIWRKYRLPGAFSTAAPATPFPSRCLHWWAWAAARSQRGATELETPFAVPRAV